MNKLLSACGALPLACTTTALGTAAAHAAAPSEPPADTVWLDTYETPNDGAAGPVMTRQTLQDDLFQVITVDGTFTAWPKPLDCGVSEPIRYASPSARRPDARAGIDAETVLAQPCSASGAFPRHNPVLRMNLAGTSASSDYHHVEPVGGPYTSPQADHTYTYIVRGQNHPASFSFLVRDGVTSDNAGMLRIQVRAGWQGDCKDGGWTRFSVFKNQGDCVSYFATRGGNPPANG